MKYFILLFFATLMIGGGAAYHYLGFSQPVTITTANQGPFQMIFKDHIGPYHEIMEAIEEVEKWAKASGVECINSVGEYIDDPEVVDHDRLRSRGGCIVQQVPAEIPKQFGSETIPNKEYLVATFDGAPSIGPFKVYPKVKNHLQASHLKSTGSVYEIYEVRDVNKLRTTYLFSTSP